VSNKNGSKLYADERVITIIAAQVVLITSWFLLTNCLFPVLLLIADFALRAFTLLPSPLAAIAKLIANLLGLRSKPIFAAPKKFSAALGFVFALATCILFILDVHAGSYIVASILLLCAVLEAFFRVCLGCHVHNFFAPYFNKD